MFLGYDPHRKGYLCLTASGKSVFSRHVICNEFIFPYSMPNNPFKFSDNTDIVPNLSSSPLIIVSFSPASFSYDNSTKSLLLFPTASPPSTSTIIETQDLNIDPTITLTKDKNYKPKVFHSFFTNNTFEPSTYRQTMAHPHWLHAMQVEYDALMHNNT